MNEQYNTIEEALRALRAGEIILVTDDPDRENEGDMICAAEFATQENINFMACYAKGLICTPMSAEIAGKLGFMPMVAENTDNHQTAFTVSVDYKDTTTGISAAERSLTMRKCTWIHEKMRGRRCKARGFPQTGACFSADFPKGRRACPQWAYGSYRGSLPSGRAERMWDLL